MLKLIYKIIKLITASKKRQKSLKKSFRKKNDEVNKESGDTLLIT